MMNENDDFYSNIDPDINHYNTFMSSTSCEFYSSDSFIDKFPNDSNNISVFHINIRSMNSNGDDLSSFLSSLEFKFDIICITETWFNDYCFKDYFPNYNGFHSYRNDGRRGGGCSIYVSKYLNAKILDTMCINSLDIECIFLQIHQSRKPIYIGCLYRPPNSNQEIFLNFINEKIRNVNLSQNICMIAGDFNVDFLRYHHDSAVSRFFDDLYSVSLIPTITLPTRQMNECSSLIDNIFVSNPVNFESGVLNLDISDHLAVFFIYKNICERNLEPLRIRYRVENEQCLENLYQELDSYDFKYLLNITDENLSIKMLHEKILESYNKHCPIKSKLISYKYKENPWITPIIKYNMKKRQKYFDLYKRNLMSFSEYKSFRNVVTNQIRISKKYYFHNLFHRIRYDVKKVWNTINNVLSSKHKNDEIKSMKFDNLEISDRSEIAKTFNSYFSSIGKSISESIIPNNQSNNISSNVYSIQNSFCFKMVTAYDVHKIIMSLKNKSGGFETYPTRIIKFLSNILSPILAIFINKSLQTGTFPNFLKKAKVIPIFKSGNQDNFSNYRPISMLPIISKIYEKIVHLQLYDFLEKFNILSESQYGFRKNKSTHQAILRNMQYVYNNLDAENIVISFF